MNWKKRDRIKEIVLDWKQGKSELEQRVNQLQRERAGALLKLIELEYLFELSRVSVD